MASHSGELPIPRVVQSDSKALELVRVWASNGSQHISFRTDLWEDPAAWGIMLVDLAKLVAKAYDKDDRLPRAKALTRIKEGFDAEWSHATDDPKLGRDS